MHNQRQALFTSLLATALILFGCGANADSSKPAQEIGQFRAGTHYQIVSQERVNPSSEKIEVVEVFWYGCPHCFSLEPQVKAWKTGIADDVEFIAMPAALNRSWKQHAKAYYAAEALGILDASHQKFFNALNTEKRKIMSDDALAEFYSQFGPSEEEFKNAMASFGVDSQVRRAEKLARHWELNSVPTLIVNGKYVTSGSIAGGSIQLFKLVDELVAYERAQSGGNDD